DDLGDPVRGPALLQRERDLASPLIPTVDAGGHTREARVGILPVADQLHVVVAALRPGVGDGDAEVGDPAAHDLDDRGALACIARERKDRPREDARAVLLRRVAAARSELLS